MRSVSCSHVLQGGCAEGVTMPVASWSITCRILLAISNVSPGCSEYAESASN